MTAPPADVQPDVTQPVVTIKVATDQVVEQPAEITTDPTVTTPLAGVVRLNVTYPVATTNVATDQAVDTDTAMQHSQQEDPEVGVVLSAIHSNTMPDANVSASMGREGHSLLQQWDQMELHNGKLWRRFHHPDGSHSHLQLVAPISCRQQILEDVHAGAVGGHLGQRKTLSLLRTRFYWPGHATDVKNFCRTCHVCSARKSPIPTRRANLHMISTGYPMQVVAVDIVGPFPTTPAGNKYILVAMDYFTRWAEVYAIPNQEAITVANKLVDEMFLRFSPPDQLHSDQGRQFELKLIAETCKILGVKKTRTTAYHPQCDGLVERFNRTLLGMLATCARDHPSSWESHLQKVCFAYNSSKQPTTGYSPSFLMLGRDSRLPIELAVGSAPTTPTSPSQYAVDLQTQLVMAYRKVRKHMATTHNLQKKLFDRRVHGMPYSVGDLVWLHSPQVPSGQSPKLYCPWTGPYHVVTRISDVTYRIRCQTTTRVVHFKPCPRDIRDKRHLAIAASSITPDKPHHFGEHITLPTDVDPTSPTPRRYPACSRRPPDRFQVRVHTCSRRTLKKEGSDVERQHCTVAMHLYYSSCHVHVLYV